MRPTSATMIRMKDSELFNFKRLLPSMTWKPENLYAIYQRTHRDGAVVKDIDFTRSSRSVFQQRWLAKRLLKSYHSSFITTKKLERWWLPRSIPAIHTHSAASTASSGVVEDVDGKLGGESLATKDNGAFGAPRRPGSTSYSELTSNSALSRYVEGRETAGGRTLDEKAMKAKKREATIPLGSLVFIHVERRLDVVIFRSCFASSVYAAKSLVVGGKVKVNGQLIRNANTLLRPGDVVSVDPKAISFIQPYKPRAAKPAEDEENAESEEDSGADKPAKQDDAHKASGNDKPFGECFTLPDYASPHIFVPAYLLPSYLTCSVVYVRHPTARPYYSEIPSPFDAGGELMSLAWEWWNKKMPKMAGRSRQWYNPQRTQERHQLPRRETYRVETGGVFNRMSPSRRPQRPVIKRTSKSVVKRASKPVAQSADQPVTKKIRPQREPRSRPAASKPVESIHSS